MLGLKKQRKKDLWGLPGSQLTGGHLHTNERDILPFKLWNTGELLGPPGIYVGFGRSNLSA